MRDLCQEKINLIDVFSFIFVRPIEFVVCLLDVIVT